MKRKNIKRLAISLIMILTLLSLTACNGNLKIPSEYNYDLSEYIKLADYKGIEYDKITVTVTQSDLQDKIDEALDNAATKKEVKSGTVDKNCTVNIDFVGSIDGKEFDGGSAEGQELDIANSNYIEGFAEQIVGHSVGETFDIHVTFPEDYQAEEYAGKDATFKITVNSMTKKVKPSYDVKFVKNNTDFDNIADYEADLKKQIQKEKEEKALTDEKQEVLKKIVEASKVLKYPKDEYYNRYNAAIKTYKGQAAMQGMELEDYIVNSLKMKKKDFYNTVKKSARTEVKNELVLHALAEAEGMEFTDKDYQKFADDLLASVGMTAESFQEKNEISIVEYAEQNNLFTTFLYEKVMDKVLTYSVAK